MTTLLTENIETLIPDLPKMRQSISSVTKESKAASGGGNKAFILAKQVEESVEELKGEFEYMKTRFSPQFVQRVDKSLA